MSEQAVTGRMTFREAAAADMPKKIVVARVSEVLDANVSKSGNYIVQPIQLDAFGAGRSIKYYLLYRPEWFRPDFDPNTIADTLEDEAEAKSLLGVYRRHISGKGSTSALRGLAGSDEKFDILANAILSLSEITMEAVTTVIRDFLVEENADQLVGYELKQKSTKTGDVNLETGKAVYIKENGYEIDTWWDVNEKNIKAKQKYAENSKGRVQFTYDPDTDAF